MNGGIIALVPVRSLAAGKTRLASVLTPFERAELTKRMVAGVIRAASQTEAIRTVLVVSPDPEALAFAAAAGPRVVPLLQPAGAPGLLPALEIGRARAEELRASGLLVLFGDLPLLDGDDIRGLVRRDAPVVIAPDRHGHGTNALLLRLSAIGAGEPFRFQFGEGSYGRHVAEAHRLGLDVATSIAAGTSFDLDTPEDLDELRRHPRFAGGQMAAQPRPGGSRSADD